ncbi:hypothetical protein P170DRAFT_480822 [Aspergillus steynii IBT 23096]|uniref:Uncharacterized protein n=1 Tax=Aspergillus steynii IBT 23096 TaxID=1392250 RepID=A0A2I2FTA2_9EURO|nr:uncharacterized protein P170DRAFT_480822 [Aspergillus steynii IBT 23096]PLB43873.1 hypothetical protein P170DRAFT_480822 [Aspergillus steynii IBT 23096]
MTCLVLSSLSYSHPLPHPGSIQPRSPSPANYPGSDDIVSDVLSSLGFTHLAKLNHWKSWQDANVIDDSNSTTPTSTEHGNQNTNTKDVTKEEQSDILNPATDPFGFVSGIFDFLSHRFSEAKNSRDEHTLN